MWTFNDNVFVMFTPLHTNAGESFANYVFNQHAINTTDSSTSSPTEADIPHLLAQFNAITTINLSYFHEDRIEYDIIISTPGLSYDATSQTLTIDTIMLSAENHWPSSVYVMVFKENEAGEQWYIGCDIIPMDASGVGVFSFTDSPIVLNTDDEYLKIWVFRNRYRIEFITEHFVKPVLFGF
jgi:hypothetical protein